MIAGQQTNSTPQQARAVRRSFAAGGFREFAILGLVGVAFANLCVLATPLVAQTTTDESNSKPVVDSEADKLVAARTAEMRSMIENVQIQVAMNKAKFEPVERTKNALLRTIELVAKLDKAEIWRAEQVRGWVGDSKKPFWVESYSLRDGE